ncbi:MAG TPA: membrane protein insertion efficiency factor YidD [Solirubrobacterales bacterium]
MKRLLLAAVSAYRRWLSPALPRRCRYEPTCSAYAAEAIRRHGAARGAVLAGWRLLRCNPFSHGGFDPVPGRFTLRVGPVDPADYHHEART